nr:immunoglobulin light chain junction region [Macaca mulatta]
DYYCSSYAVTNREF